MCVCVYANTLLCIFDHIRSQKISDFSVSQFGDTCLVSTHRKQKSLSLFKGLDQSIEKDLTVGVVWYVKLCVLFRIPVVDLPGDLFLV